MMISKLFPELNRLHDRATRRKALSVAIAEVSMRWQYWAALAAIVAVSVWAQFSLRRLGIPPEWRGTVGQLVVVATVLACWLLALVFRKTIRRVIWRVLADNDIACCVGCGYDLTGNASGVCPECGARNEDAKTSDAPA